MCKLLKPNQVASSIAAALVVSGILYKLKKRIYQVEALRPLSACLSHVFFWPTVPFTVLTHRRWTHVDEWVVLGLAPVVPGWPRILAEEHNVGGGATGGLSDHQAPFDPHILRNEP